ncbi:aldolase [Metarhizium guizhouense ARSEF 977]|uniref:Aldolase n=1 Tax=Metarhizium guizhouense (strain ARSEF 977) TaxID=1276136 RepID=A0A0B4H111_METGA|nr:aldolase [Metarhizium guizhouense ARSEF 977]
MNTRADEEAGMEFEVDSLSRGPNQLKGIPKFPSFHEHRKHIVVHMAAVFRNWARVGFTEGISGHISVRDPEHHGLIWMNPHREALWAAQRKRYDLSEHQRRRGCRWEQSKSTGTRGSRRALSRGSWLWPTFEWRARRTGCMRRLSRILSMRLRWRAL